MDQDSFRELLSSRPSSSKASASNTLGAGTRQRGSLLAPQQSSSKTKPEAGDTASFQPRKVKKAAANANYRDRAAERRSGADHEFTHVETLLNEFEERNKGHDKSTIDEQRKYLGGDSEHSVLVKGLDFALLEQNKAKVATISNVEDDEALEQAFLGVDGGTPTDTVETVPQPKKSRQDLIRELKEKRGQDRPAENKATVTEAGIEVAKKAGKFKPIGFKPIGGDSEGKKRKKEKEGGEKKKKKRKVDEVKGKPDETPGLTQSPAPPLSATLPEKGKQPASKPEPLDPDFDIFAGVEEYTGDIEDDEDEDEHLDAEGSQEPQPEIDQPRRGWFDEPKSPTPPPKEPTPPPAEEPSGTKGEEMEEEPGPMRLAPLASAMSVKDILAIDDAAAKEEKRKARKEKKKKKAELNAEGKANRDYQKLMAYEQKKSK